jgi:hypothetical protein
VCRQPERTPADGLPSAPAGRHTGAFCVLVMSDNHGDKRTGSERPKGSGNKTGAELRQSAQEHTQDALDVLLEIMQSADTRSA